MYIALKKLDTDTARAFETDKRGVDFPTFDSLIRFLRKNIKVLSRTSGNKAIPQGNKNNNKTVTHTLVSTNTRNNTDTAPAHKKQKCSLCSSQHEHLYQCSGFQKLAPTDRYKHAKFNNYCINCRSNRHVIRDCNSSSSCRWCQRKHHSMLHFDSSAHLGRHLRTALGSDHPHPRRRRLSPVFPHLSRPAQMTLHYARSLSILPAVMFRPLLLLSRFKPLVSL
ncbi:unnamed protein product [Arctia plantaginis]|uniref:Uncharacterized protein n=1 Tax=Arctia plantaginis TaxID=874455 RepID=A0A8S1B7H1_ARCPL|nr:unnamed protein product [Arctia plantaginis]